jgi:hypothetical protein
MNEQNQEQTQLSEVTDLTVEPKDADEIKGGPKRIFIGGLSVADSADAAQTFHRLFGDSNGDSK